MSDRFINQKVLADHGSNRLISATDRQTQQAVILRTYKTSNRDERQALELLLAALAELRHPNIEPVHEILPLGDEVAIRTDPIQGETISQIVAGGPLSVDEFRMLAKQMLSALAAAHERGIVHGSLNADRILCRREPNAPWTAVITGYGCGFGTSVAPDDFTPYLCVPPEQWEQQPAHRRSDVYSLGCIFYQALSGKSPFDGKTLKEVRHKHLHHDVVALHKVAPQAPQWMCDWVMSLITAAPDLRVKSGQIALDELERAEATANAPATVSPTPPPGRLAPTTGYAPIAQPALAVPNPPATHPVMIPANPARPGAAQKGSPGPRRIVTGGPQTGRPLRARPDPFAGHHRKTKRIWILGATTAVAVGAALWLGLSRRSKGPIKVVDNPQQSAIPTRPAASPRPLGPPRGNDLPPVQGGYPAGRQKPPNDGQLVFHAMGDGGVLGLRTDAGGRPQPALLGDPVFAWKDYAERGRESTLYHPGQGNTFAQFIARKPDATFPLSKEHRFVRFKGDGSPPAALSFNPKNQARDFPFGSANPTSQKGLTFAVVMFQEIKGYQQTVIHLSSQHGSAVLRLGERGDLRLSTRVSGVPETQQAPTISIGPDKFNPVEPLLVVGVWRSDPSEVQLRVRSASGWAHQTPPAKAPTPRDSLGNLLMGREPLPGPSSPNKSTDARSLRAFCGGVAELLVYATGLSESDLAVLEKQLSSRYFPAQK